MSNQSVLLKEILDKVESSEISTDEGFLLLKDLKRNLKPSSEKKDPLDVSETKYYQYEWKESKIESPHPDIPDIMAEDSRNILLFDTNAAVESKLRQLEDNNNKYTNKIILVEPADSFKELDRYRYHINPHKASDFIQLISILKERQLFPKHILYLWARKNLSEGQSDINRNIAQGLYSVFFISRALMKSKPKDHINLYYYYPVSNKNNYPEFAALAGYMKTIHKENPKFIYKQISYDFSSLLKNQELESDLVPIIMNELNHQADNDIEINYQGPRRFVRRLKEINLNTPGEGKIKLRGKGVYLITGGMGALGQLFAQYIANNVNATIILSGRSDLNIEGKKKIKNLEALGSQAIYKKGDVSQEQDLKKLINFIKIQFGQINGIIHSAGVIRDSFILMKKEEEIKDVIAPKVFGTVYLDDLTQKEKLDFFVMFSSIAAAFGNIGQADYAYANSYLDNYAIMRESLRKKGKRHGKTISINWPLWQEGGMDISEMNLESMKNTKGVIPLTTIKGIKAFEKGLNSEINQLVVIEKLKGEISNLAEQDADTSIIIRKKEEDNNGLRGVREQHLVGLKQKAEQLVKGIVSKETKVPISRINARDSFERYGIDSVKVMSMTKEMEESFGELSKTIFFEYQNIDELSSYLVEEHQNKLIELTGYSSMTRTGTIEQNLSGGDAYIDSCSSQSPNANERIYIKESAAENQDIAIIGINGRYPMARNLEEFWQNLKTGQDCISEIPKERWDYRQYYDPDKNHLGKSYSKWGGFIDDVDKFDPIFFNISPREADIIDPQERIFLEVVWHTVEDAGYTRQQLERFKTGVFVGVMWGQYQLEKINVDGNIVSPGSPYWSIANRASYFFNFNGPSLAIDTACSSSLVAVHLACESIRKAESEIAIAGGVNLTLHPNKYIQLSISRFASSDGRCRSFGEGGDGYVPGEGIGAILLKGLNKAIADGDNIYAVIKGSSINHGGRTNGYTVPNPNAQAELILDTLRNANVDPRTINYIEAHGTGTSLGDPVEIAGITKAYRRHTDDKQFCSIGSVKSNIGHLESASGIAAITKVILQMRNKQLVPSLHSNQLNPNIKFKDTPFYVQHKLEKWEKVPNILEDEQGCHPRRAGISSFGAGGTNAHVILEEFGCTSSHSYISPHSESREIEGPQLFILSAKDEERLNEYIRHFVSYLKRRIRAASAVGVNSISFINNIQEDLLILSAEILKVNVAILDIEENLSECGIEPIGFSLLGNKINEKYKIKLVPNIFLLYSTIKELSHYLYQEYQNKIQDYYQKNIENDDIDYSNVSLNDIARTLQVRREMMEVRVAIIAETAGDLILKMEAFLDDENGQNDLFYGSAKNSKNLNSILAEDENIKKTIKNWFDTREFHKLSELWVNGIAIDWYELNKKCPYKKQSLPPYPFSKTRYWVSTIGLDKSETTSTTRLEEVKKPLNDKVSTDKNEVPCRQDITSEVTNKKQAELRSQVQKELIQIASGILQIDPDIIESDEGLNEYGFESITLTEFSNQINNKFGIELDIAVFSDLEDISVKSIAGYLLKEYNKNIATHYSVVFKEAYLEEKEEANYTERVDNEFDIGLVNNIQNDLMTIFSNIFQVDLIDINFDDDLQEFGFESITVTEFCSEISKLYNFTLDTAFFNDLQEISIQSISEYILEEFQDRLIHHYSTSEAAGLSEETSSGTIQKKMKDLNSLVQEENTAHEPPYSQENFSDNRYNESSVTLTNVKEAHNKVVITGIGVVSPAGIEINKFWDNLMKGKSFIEPLGDVFKPFELPDKSEPFGASIHNFNFFKEIKNPVFNLFSDKAVKYALVAAKKAKEDSKLKYKPGSSDVGVYVSTTTGGINTSFNAMIGYYNISEKGKKMPDNFLVNILEKYLARKLLVGLLPGYWSHIISSYFKTGGPAIALGTSCLSGGESIGACYRAIKNGEIKAGIAVGADAPLVFPNYLGFKLMGAVTDSQEAHADRGRAFCKGRKGMVFGEGAGALILETEEHARKRGARIYAEIKGYSTTLDGSGSMVHPIDSGEGLYRCIKNTLNEGNCSSTAIEAISAHGTGTYWNDKTESKAFKNFFKQDAYNIPIFSIKPMIGHSFGGSTAIETVACVLALENQMIPPTINYDEKDEDCDLDYTPNHPRKAKLNTILKTALGFGGTNLAILLNKYQQ